jgi:hypothetical protein
MLFKPRGLQGLRVWIPARDADLCSTINNERGIRLVDDSRQINPVLLRLKPKQVAASALN